MIEDRTSAPKADALPGCATPRTAPALRFSAIEGQAISGLGGKERQNAAGTGVTSPGIVPNQRSRTVPYRLAPTTVKAAQAWVRVTHRHLPTIQGGLFAAAVHNDAGPVAMGIAVNPPRVWMGTGRIVIGRVAAVPGLEPVGEHAAPACTMIYGSLCRAAKALGYIEAWTYTLPGESGVTLRAAGFTYQGETQGGEWDRPSRSRKPATHAVKKGRWMRRLSA